MTAGWRLPSLVHLPTLVGSAVGSEPGLGAPQPRASSWPWLQAQCRQACPGCSQTPCVGKRIWLHAALPSKPSYSNSKVAIPAGAPNVLPKQLCDQLGRLQVWVAQSQKLNGETLLSNPTNMPVGTATALLVQPVAYRPCSPRSPGGTGSCSTFFPGALHDKKRDAKDNHVLLLQGSAPPRSQLLSHSLPIILSSPSDYFFLPKRKKNLI